MLNRILLAALGGACLAAFFGIQLVLIAFMEDGFPQTARKAGELVRWLRGN